MADHRGRHLQPGESDRRLSTTRGSGTFGAAFGLLVVLLLLLFATQLAYDLYATSAATGAAADAARTVAGHDAAADRAGAAAREGAALRQRLGGGGEREVHIEWQLGDPGFVGLRIVLEHPSLLPARWSARTPLGRLDRTIVVRREDR